MQKSLAKYLDWNNWLKREEYLKGVDFTLSNELSEVFKIELGKVRNSVVLEAQPVAAKSFEAEFLQPELEAWWNSSTVKIKAGGGHALGLKEYFSKKNYLALELSPFAGNGHLKEAALKTSLLTSALGIKSWLIQPEEYMTGIQALIFGTKSQLHKYMQLDQLSPQKYDEVFANILAYSNKIQDVLVANSTKNLARFVIAATGGDNSNDDLARMAKATTEKIDTAPAIAKWILRTLVDVDERLSEAQLGDIINRIALFAMTKGNDLALIDSSHPFVVRAFIAAYPEMAKFTQALTPDRGFLRKVKGPFAEQIVRDNFMLQIFSFKQGKTNAVMLSPSADITQSFREIFNLHGAIVETGELLDSITPLELKNKWNLKRKNVVVMVNGNASNATTIHRSVIDYIKHEGNKKYNLAVCLFSNSLDSIFNLHEIKMVEEFAQVHPDNFKIIFTENKIETALISRNIPKWAHLSIGKPPGENVFMSAAVGCLEACSYSRMANEQNNMLYNTNKAILCNYPAGSAKRWLPVLESLTPEARDIANTGLEIKSGNFVEYLDNLNENDFAMNFVVNGYLRSEHLNTLHNLLVSTAQIAGQGLDPDTQDDILAFMAGAQERFNDKIFADFKKEFGFSKVELISRILGLPVSELSEANLILPNKYISTLENEMLVQKNQHEADKKYQSAITTGIMFAGAIAITGLVLKWLEQKNKKQQ